MTRKRIPDNCPEFGSLETQAHLWKIFHKSSRLAEPEHGGAFRVDLDVEDLVADTADLHLVATGGRGRQIRQPHEQYRINARRGVFGLARRLKHRTDSRHAAGLGQVRDFPPKDPQAGLVHAAHLTGKRHQERNAPFSRTRPVASPSAAARTATPISLLLVEVLVTRLLVLSQ